MNAGVIAAIIRPMVPIALKKLRELPAGESSRLLTCGIVDFVRENREHVTSADLLGLSRAMLDAGAELLRMSQEE